MTGAARPDHDHSPDRRRLLRRAVTVAVASAGTGVAATVGLVGTARAAPGDHLTMGTTNDSGPATTTLDVGYAGLTLRNTAGAPLRLVPGEQVYPQVQDAVAGTVAVDPAGDLFVRAGPPGGEVDSWLWTSEWATTSVPVRPTRVLDSRDPDLRRTIVSGASTLDPTGRLTPGNPIVLSLDHLVRDGRAVKGNVTVVGMAGPGFLTAWGSGARPTASTVNWSAAGQILSNFLFAELGTVGGYRSVLTVQVSAPTHVIVDLTGLLVGHPGQVPAGTAAAAAAPPVEPARVAVAPGEPVVIGVPNSPGVTTLTSAAPDGAATLALRNPTGATLELTPEAGRRPGMLDVGVVGVDPGGLYVGDGSSGGHTAYSTANATMLVPVPPTRILDTRSAAGRSRLLEGAARIDARGRVLAETLLVVHLRGLVEYGDGMLGNLTVADTTRGGFATVWGTGGLPVASTVNWWTAGQLLSNGVITQLGDYETVGGDHYPDVVGIHLQKSAAAVVLDLTGLLVHHPDSAVGARPGPARTTAGSAGRRARARAIRQAAAPGAPVVGGQTNDAGTAETVLVGGSATAPTLALRGTGPMLRLFPTPESAVPVELPTGSLAVTPVGDLVVGGRDGRRAYVHTSRWANRTVAVPPVRLLDTRALASYSANVLAGADGVVSGRLQAGRTLHLTLGRVPSVPDGVAVGAFLNVTVADTVAGGVLTAFQAGVTRPETSSLNWWGPNQVLSNLVEVPLGVHDGEPFAFAVHVRAATAVIVDVSALILSRPGRGY
ncbi:hypothetical protein [Micromonospora rifamycinica]|uniref:Uncharacterized protein n=1 Tax=Micromonospora rifamycinica TaxID=291594 RepID=A0A1C5KCT7_9ACTN|nr:hypothetical protein [Micromonospora rifamycinica]SCG80570.1 hypothetical protein GA0070623_5112 [Micromonospora rifamycinica]